MQLHTSKPTAVSPVHRLARAYDETLKRTLPGFTLTRVKWLTALWLFNGLMSLAFVWIAPLVVLFGLGDLMRSLKPQYYPFVFTSRMLILFRIAAATYMLLGLLSIVIHWQEVQPYVQSVIDWINE